MPEEAIKDAARMCELEWLEIRRKMIDERGADETAVRYTQGVANSISIGLHLVLVNALASSAALNERLAELNARLAAVEVGQTSSKTRLRVQAPTRTIKP